MGEETDGMQLHIKNYMEHYDLVPDSYIPCSKCNKPAVDIHHIVFKSQGGSDEIENLIPLCRKCHDIAHGKG